ncbi:class I SAM-dependent methyltransferase [Nocardia sp. NBC_00511]|uniref:class I SAM-dependent methyltransferase n=1 Tax=Nocardia sp. NBC_00511 TaxID=2903591 RepID=UPI0030DF6490
MSSPPPPGLFAGTAWHYARYQPGYPQQFFDDILNRLRPDKSGRLLDLGCGTGQLTIPLAPHFIEAVGLDPEPDMLLEAANGAHSAGITNATWIQASSTDLPAQLGKFQLVTMGRSFHWMDREKVLTALGRMTDKNSTVVLANDSCMIRPATAWQQAIEAVQARYLPRDSAPPSLPDHADTRTHEQVLTHSPFPRVERIAYEFDRVWTREQAIGYLYSTSLPLRRLLGNRRADFEAEVGQALTAAEPSGILLEPVTLEVLIAAKP